MSLKVIHKEKLQVTGRQQLWLPRDAKVVHLAEQVVSRNPFMTERCIWYEFEVDDGGQTSVHGYDHRDVLMFGTGHLIDMPGQDDETVWERQGTILMSNGLVWHVFFVYGRDELDLPEVKQETVIEVNPVVMDAPDQKFDLDVKCNYCQEKAIGIFTSKQGFGRGPDKYMCDEHRKTECFVDESQ